ncbi:hypothetical protein GCM10027570_18750 [Streptomonospora sediminis]
MDAVWGAEAGVVEWVQGWGGWLEPPMHAVSALGSQGVLLALVTLLFWSVHAGLGSRAFVVTSGAALVNDLLKIVLHGARPSWYHHGVRSLTTPGTFGAPSGHAVTSLALWGYLALTIPGRLAPRVPARGVWAAAAVLVAVVGLSRIYLGAHFITDLLAGWAVAAALLWAALRYEDAVLARWRRLSLPAQLAAALALSAAPVLVAACWQALFYAGWTPPEAWTGSVPPGLNSTSLEHTAGVAGGFFGGVAGLSVLAARGWYTAAGPLVSRAARYVIGISGIVLILAVVHAAVPEAAGAVGALREFLVFALLGAWSAAGAPELYCRMGLAGRPGAGTPAGGPAQGGE